MIIPDFNISNAYSLNRILTINFKYYENTKQQIEF
jgi:hypothetical protein